MQDGFFESHFRGLGRGEPNRLHHALPLPLFLIRFIFYEIQPDILVVVLAIIIEPARPWSVDRLDDNALPVKPEYDLILDPAGGEKGGRNQNTT